jgi:hypothetical protein
MVIKSKVPLRENYLISLQSLPLYHIVSHMYSIHKPAAEEGELKVYEEPQTHMHI